MCRTSCRTMGLQMNAKSYCNIITQLRSQSRLLWSENENNFLTAIIDERGVELFRLHKSKLCIRNLAIISEETKEPLGISELKRLASSQDYKLFHLAFYFQYFEAIDGLKALIDFLEKIDLKALSISKICSSFEEYYEYDEYSDGEDSDGILTYQQKQLDLLSKVATLLGKEVVKVQEGGLTCFKFPKPFDIISDEPIQPIDGAEDLAICGNNFDENISIEEKFLSKLQSDNYLSFEELCDYYNQALEVMTPRALFHKLEDCGLRIILPEVKNSDEALAFDKIKKFFTQLFEKVKNNESSQERKDLKLPKVDLAYLFEQEYIEYEEKLKALEFTSSCFHSIQNICVVKSLYINNNTLPP
ncbi:unnamed protein product [Moneuplotes crassus]|uniref:Uncharacterized protein n=1 Tax=Euplotes crassus TaxID=5936 RepID=A0AAD1UF57_EUPCR|nr:unnamed protein product [Moneuplotes crassus]